MESHAVYVSQAEVFADLMPESPQALIVNRRTVSCEKEPSEPKKRNLKLRVTSISPGFVQTNLATSMTDPGVKAQIVERMEKMAIPPAAIAHAIAFAIEQPPEVDVNEIVIRPTAQA